MFVDALVGGFIVALLGLGLRTGGGRRRFPLLSQRVHALRSRSENPHKVLEVAYRSQAAALQQARG
jgi:hypothetical protein